MVNYQPSLDRTFAALADPTRRAMLARLGQTESLSISDLAEPFAMSLPAIMKHLDVLSDAGLIARAKTGRTVACRLTAAPMEQAMDWLNRYQRFWSEQLDRLAAFLEEDSCPPQPISATSQDLLAEPSLTIKRRFNAAPPKVFSAWTDPEKLKRWFGPGQAETVLVESDARVGGRFRIVMRAPDGEEHDVSGVYREVVPDQKLVFTWAWRTTPERESLVTVAPQERR